MFGKLLDWLRARINMQNPLFLLYHKVVAVFASLLYGMPGEKFRVIAVTGTSGKTTTVSLIADMLSAAGRNVGLISGSHFRIGKEVIVNDTKQTTLGRFALNRLLKRMARSGCTDLVIEVTSHALVQSRVWGIPVDVAVLTNLTFEHIEYHGGIEAYRDAKYMLFKNVKNAIVLNRDDENWTYFNNADAPKKLFFGIDNNSAALRAVNIVYSVSDTEFSLLFPGGDSRAVDVHLLSKANVYNALAAAAAAYAAGVSKDCIVKTLKTASGVPGRFESINEGQDFSVVVDYAHHPVSLEQLCSFYKSVTSGRLIVVFGATGGGRDKSKRPLMGDVVDRFSDYAIVADDDPYDEDRMAIIDAVASGITRKIKGKTYFIIPDRREAINFAIKKLAREGDTVIVAGKGNEPVQVIARGKIPWDDREVVREALRSIAE